MTNATTHTHQTDPATEAGASTDTSSQRAPRWLLWSTGLGALVFANAAFLLWGLNGPAYFLDLITAYCF